MIRRPPSSIPLKQDDVDDLEAFLALRRQAREAADENEAMDIEDQREQQQQSSKGKGKAKTGVAKSGSKGKGKQRAAAESTAAGGDDLVQAEEEARLAREAQSREQRIGL